MGTLKLHVLRHGQASIQADDYDQLSMLGHEQAARVGRWLVEHRVAFSAVYVGAMQRHAQTLAAIQAAYQHASLPLPIACVLPQLNEYDFRAVLSAYRQTYPDDVHLQAGRWLMVLKSALLAWAREQISAPGLESWADFQIRVADAAKHIAATIGQGEDAKEALVVTSGGVMGLLTQRALGLEDHSVAEINMAIKNTAFCEFRVSRSSWTLQSMNVLPHLSAPTDASLHTFV